MAGILTLDVRSDIRQVQQHLTGIQRKVVAPAASKSINRALTPARNEAAKAIQREINVRGINTVKKVLKIKPSTIATLTGEIIGTSAFKLNVVEMMPAGRVKLGRRKGGGITYNEFGRSTNVKYGFMIPGRFSSKVIAVVPTKRTASGVRALYSSHYVPEELIKPEVIAAIERTALAAFRRNMESELKFRLSKI